MKTTLLTVVLTIVSLTTWGQSIDFEGVAIPDTGFVKDAMNPEGFEFDGITLYNKFTTLPTFSFWSGWIMSKGTDATTEGFTNEHSSITGGGADGSSNYAVAFLGGRNTISVNEDVGSFISSLKVTNNTYAALSMQNGDGFAKKFGGESGDDPDFYRVKIFGYCNDQGQGLVDSMTYYLADYRSDNNTEDYIVNTWEELDVTGIFACDSIVMVPESSDIGGFGINTPVYICIDDVVLGQYLSTAELLTEEESFVLSSTIVSSVLPVEVYAKGQIAIYSQAGQRLMLNSVYQGAFNFDVANFTSGVYFVQFIDQDGNQRSTRFVKK